MTQIQWEQLEAAVAVMTEEEKQRLAGLLSPAAPPPTSPRKSIIGLFADEPELIEQIIQDVYIARETHPFRTGE